MRTPNGPAAGRALGTSRAACDDGGVIRTFLTPRWLLLHLLAWAMAVAMTLLGRWQLGVSNTKHFDPQNFGYALQWWAFAAFVLFFWVRSWQHKTLVREL